MKKNKITKEDLLSWRELSKQLKPGDNLDPLYWFIYRHEPTDSGKWREDLISALNFLIDSKS